VNVPVPQEDTTNRATIAAFDNCWVLSSGCDADGTFQQTGIQLSSVVTSSLSWVDFTSTGVILTTTQEIDFTPTKTEIGDHAFSVVFTPANGSPYTFTWTLTVTCEVTAFSPPAAPNTGLTYNIYDPVKTWDYTVETWTQSPDCGYLYDSVFTWEGVTAGGAVILADGILTILSQTRADASGSTTAKLVNTITITNNGPGASTTFTPATDSDKVVWTYEILDPCATATID
jgi:hypothetical protein